MMMNARWITTSASATKASTVTRSKTSPCWYVVFAHPSVDVSNGRRAIPMIFSTAGSCSSAVTAEIPIAPVGPVTATVIPTRSFSHDLWQPNPRKGGAWYDDKAKAKPMYWGYR